ncbi:MAG: DUF1080 domain-containing protein [Betaproteobacteria bacterium]|nr:DUF1080 domain-containing protein [Betaproteobacteria bacterium]
MKRLSLAASLLALTLAVFGCAQMESMGDWFSTQWDSIGGGVTLIDGDKGLENWNRVGEANWSAGDGVIMADKRTGKNPGYLVSKKTYTDFQLKIEFWASHDSNSGIFMRCADPERITDRSCYEANIFDTFRDQKYATGSIVRHAPVVVPIKAGGKWNTYEITARGPNLVVVLNGTKTTELNHSQFASGPFALQYGQGIVKFRKVQIKEL